jgi:hypothetical protein
MSLRNRALADATKLLRDGLSDAQKSALGRIRLELWHGPYYLVEGEDEPLRWEELFGRNVSSASYFGSKAWEQDCELVRAAFPDEVFFDIDCGLLTVDPESVGLENIARFRRRDFLGELSDYL